VGVIHVGREGLRLVYCFAATQSARSPASQERIRVCRDPAAAYEKLAGVMSEYYFLLLLLT